MLSCAEPIRFSVIIPTYNYAHYLDRAIDSVLHQQFEPAAEVIVVDDGSTDHTPDVAAEYGTRIRYVRQSNQGVSVARNRGIEAAQAEWIVFLDADDRLLPTALSQFAGSIRKHSAARLHFGHYFSIDEEGHRREAFRRPSMREPLKNFEAFVRRLFTISRGTACYHRTVFNRIRFPVGITHGEDLVVDGQVLACFPAASCGRPLAEIYDHPGRCRDTVSRLKDCGTAVVDALFDPAILPDSAMLLRPLFLSRWYLTLGRAAFLANDFAEARQFYRLAAHHRWTSLLHVTHGMRYLESVLRAA
jgi:glycosyltransferase involved in cell wall biosynthesis